MLSREGLSDSKMHELANDVAQNITIRTYDKNGSNDGKREATQPERIIIHNIMFAMLAAYRFDPNCNLQSITDTGEYALHQFIPNANGYDTIYIPFNNIIEGRWTI